VVEEIVVVCESCLLGLVRKYLAEMETGWSLKCTDVVHSRLHPVTLWPCLVDKASS